MEVTVRPAAPADRADDLLYVSARRYYDAYAGGEAAARRMLRRVHPRPGHAASAALCRVAEADGRVVGVIAGFPVSEAEQLARRFLTLTAPRLAPWRWAPLLRHLVAAADLAPSPPAGSWYVDALAVAPEARRRGVAAALLADAERAARRHGAGGVALDTGLENEPAQRLYERRGFERRDVRRVRDARAARAIGGAGFVGYYKALG